MLVGEGPPPVRLPLVAPPGDNLRVDRLLPQAAHHPAAEQVTAQKRRLSDQEPQVSDLEGQDEVHVESAFGTLVHRSR